MKRYAVKKMFLSLQGEGLNAGRRAVFVRFAGCNLWSGMEDDREAATCQFCDTDFVGTDGTHGGRYDAVKLASTVGELWGRSGARPRFVVLTGGEPLLQADSWLATVLHRWQCEIAVETNGAIPVPYCFDWVTVSPKAGAELVQKTGQELKLVFPQKGAEPERFADLGFRHFYLQPMDGPDLEANTRAAIDYCLEHPQWRLSVQAHKHWGLR